MVSLSETLKESKGIFSMKESKGIFQQYKFLVFFVLQNKEFLQEKMLQRAPTITERSKKVLKTSWGFALVLLVLYACVHIFNGYYCSRAFSV